MAKKSKTATAPVEATQKTVATATAAVAPEVVAAEASTKPAASADPTVPATSDEFDGLDPTSLDDPQIRRLDFGAIIALGLDDIDAMDDGLTKSGALADARNHLNLARELVEGVQSGRLY